MQQIITLCDVCGENGAKPATPVVVALGAKPRAQVVVDLCDEHERVLIEPVRALLDQYGRKIVDGSPASSASSTSQKRAAAENDDKGRPFPCIFCERPMKTRSGLTFHLDEAHGFTSPAEAYGGARCPLCAQNFATATGLGAHAKSHGELGRDGTHGLYRAALEGGDPHAIIAKRLAEVGSLASPQAA